jgi:hypothetical protein
MVVWRGRVTIGAGGRNVAHCAFQISQPPGDFSHRMKSLSNFVFVQFLAGMALQLQIQALCPRPEKFN